jgi:hypothetical protein
MLLKAAGQCIIKPQSSRQPEVDVADTGRFAFDLPSDLAARLESAVPPGQRSAFIVEAIHTALRTLERDRLKAEMEECAREMYDEILQIEAEFHPLEEEIHRLL